MTVTDIVTTSTLIMAETVNGTYGRHPVKHKYTQHAEIHLGGHARNNSKVRVLHWNAQGLNNKSKQFTLIAALQLDDIDIAMIQDSRILAINDGKPIRILNCHTYFIPVSWLSNDCPEYSTLYDIPGDSNHGRHRSAKHYYTIYIVSEVKRILQGSLTGRLHSILAGDFNAHHTMWCMSTDGPAQLTQRLPNVRTRLWFRYICFYVPGTFLYGAYLVSIIMLPERSENDIINKSKTYSNLHYCFNSCFTMCLKQFIKVECL